MQSLNRPSLLIKIFLSLIVALVIGATLVGSRFAHAQEHEAELINFVETEETLTLNLNTRVDETSLLATNNNREIIWKYVGPATNDDHQNCNESGWLQLSSYAQDVEAVLQEGEDAKNPKQAFVTLDLPDNANNRTWWCFQVPLSVLKTPQDERTTAVHYISYTLKEIPDLLSQSVIFKTAPPIKDTSVPKSLEVAPNEDVGIDDATWQYAKVASHDDCNNINTELRFNSPAATNNNLTLTDDDAGTIFCFRVKSAALGDAETHIYGSYAIAGGSTTITTIDEPRNNLPWIITGFVILALGVTAIIIFRSR